MDIYIYIYIYIPPFHLVNSQHYRSVYTNCSYQFYIPVFTSILHTIPLQFFIPFLEFTAPKMSFHSSQLDAVTAECNSDTTDLFPIFLGVISALLIIYALRNAV